MDDVSAELPRYRCHKEVHALKIRTVIEHESYVTLKFDEPFAPIDMIAEVASRFHFRDKNGQHDLGYYVVYDDGYFSWSPTAAFEEGYMQI